MQAKVVTLEGFGVQQLGKYSQQDCNILQLELVGYK